MHVELFGLSKPGLINVYVASSLQTILPAFRITQLHLKNTFIWDNYSIKEREDYLRT